MLYEARDKMKNWITLKKKSDPEKFAIQCMVKGVEFPHALCDTGASVSILPRVIADHLGLKVESSMESFTFVDCFQRSSGGIVRVLEAQIGNALDPVDLHVLERFHWEEKDEFGVYRDDQGHARDVDGHVISVSKDDIRSLLERASMNEHIYICLPEHARSYTQNKLVPEIYTKDEINEMLYGVNGAQEKNEDDFQMKFNGLLPTE
ncbi:hypothetical protein DY000_02040965 [Brassica cretica]|uniref:Aspartic peptidase DDI1-type domain-containing protein n=1 Tax=Brassica cretica TaxID=69181 RepID=A0ABQ7B759_BRACR|nr:hypothetical protein DY000_02040965 [Brassica cretica]